MRVVRVTRFAAALRAMRGSRWGEMRDFAEAIRAKRVPYVFDGKRIKAHALAQKAEGQLAPPVADELQRRLHRGVIGALGEERKQRPGIRDAAPVDALMSNGCQGGDGGHQSRAGTHSVDENRRHPLHHHLLDIHCVVVSRLGDEQAVSLE